MREQLSMRRQTFAAAARFLGKVARWSLVLALLGFMASLVAGELNQHRVSGLSAAAERLGFEDSLEGLADHISRVLDPGMSREQVERALLDIGQVEVEPQESLESDGRYSGRAEVKSHDEISLEILDWIPIFGEVSGVDFPMVAYYDQQGRLVRCRYDDSHWWYTYPWSDGIDPLRVDITR